jgi:RNA polymerase sigma-70 factor (ECF subfamily)
MEYSAEAPFEEPELIQRARLGESPAWTALMRLHQEPIFRFAYLLMGDPDEAEDIAQETFIRAYRALERFDSERPMRPWLLRIAANLASNRRRSLARYFTALQRAFQQEKPDLKSVEEHPGQSGRARQVWEAVRQLKPADAQVIYLRFFLDLSTEEAAQALDVPAGTVKSRLHRASERLRQVIEAHYPGLKEDWE